MGMKRRTVLKLSIGFCAALAGTLLRPLGRFAPKRWGRALRGKSYPGPLKRWNEKDLGKPGKWAG
jgi:hypothetical protein